MLGATSQGLNHKSQDVNRPAVKGKAMQRNKRNGILLSAGLFGVGTVLGLSTSATAAGRNDVKQERRDVKEARKEVKQERKDLRKADTPAERRDAREDLRDAQRDLRNEQYDLRQERREDNRWDNNRGRNDNWNHNNQRPNWNNSNNNGYHNGYYPNRPGQPYYGNPGYGYGQPNYGAQTYTGIVTGVRSDQSFDVRIGGDTFNVYLSTRLPRQLNTGDYVRVYGVRSGNNDIRNASVSILNNR